ELPREETRGSPAPGAKKKLPPLPAPGPQTNTGIRAEQAILLARLSHGVPKGQPPSSQFPSLTARICFMLCPLKFSLGGRFDSLALRFGAGVRRAFHSSYELCICAAIP